jgi:hypothetical protein
MRSKAILDRHESRIPNLPRGGREFGSAPQPRPASVLVSAPVSCAPVSCAPVSAPVS